MAVERVQAVERRRGLLRLCAVAVGLGVVYALIPLQDDRWGLGVGVGLVVLLAIVPFTVRRAAAIEQAAQPMFAAAEAVLIVVAMLVFAFSSAYLAIDGRGVQFEGLDTKIDALYFTVTTLSTVGYGDVHAVGQLARVAVTVQIVVDLTLLAVSVRAIIGAARRRTGGAAPPS
ncbi:MAG: two pore domain potassium channel family protein [Actinobacteria bacterium]|nr:two pore domain potassium channel family protein [Actinomycetota bacterium]